MTRSVAFVLSMALGIAAPLRAEGALVQITSAKFGNLFYDTEAKGFDVTVYSGLASVSGVLVTEVKDPYGVVVLHDEFPLSIIWSAVTRSLTLQSTLKGRFTITARLLDQALLTEPPLASAESAIGVVTPPPTPGLDDRSAMGYFVFPAEGGDYDETANAGAIAQEMQDLGIKWVRYGYRWSTDTRLTRPDTTDPAWLDTSHYDLWVNAFRVHGINVLANLSGSARWASTQPDNEEEITYQGVPLGLGQVWGASSPVAADWALFVRTMQERFSGRIDHWEIWNEPDGYIFFEPLFVTFPAVTAQRLAALVTLSAATIKEVNPNARVMVGFAGISNLLFESNFVPRAWPSLNMFGYHYGDVAAVTYAKSMPSRYGFSAKPFWNTEAFGGTQDALPSWIHQRAAGATRIFPFIWASFQSDPVRFGVAPIGPGYTPRPLALAVRILSDQIGQANFVRNFAIRNDGSLNGYIFDDAGRTVIAVLREDPTIDVWAPALPGLQLVARVPPGTTSVTAIDGMGNATTLVPNAGEVRVPLDGNPVYVEGLDVHFARPLEFVGFTTTACGNGTIDPGEECDDGNTVNNDSCSNSCAYTCPPVPTPGCADASGASISLRAIPLQSGSNKLVFKWTGSTASPPDLGDPFSTTSYALCLYQQQQGGSERVMTVAAPPGGTCGTRPCWTGRPPLSVVYADRARTADGLRTLLVKASAAGSVLIKLTAAGVELPLPALPLTTPVTAQVQATNGTCWQTTFDTAVIRNDGIRFSALHTP